MSGTYRLWLYICMIFITCKCFFLDVDLSIMQHGIRKMCSSSSERNNDEVNNCFNANYLAFCIYICDNK